MKLIELSGWGIARVNQEGQMKCLINQSARIW